MPFIEKITGLRSLAIIGTAKNTGKTECLNYVLRRLAEDYPDLSVALTSIGIDGERRDQVTQTDKPEICLRPEMFFVTAENFYRRKLLSAEVLGIDERYTTSLGKTIYARAKGTGKILIAGPPSTGGLRQVIAKMQEWGVSLTIVDGALSRMSLAAPSVAEGMILATGAAYSAQPDQLVRRMVELQRLICLPELADRPLADSLADIEQGMRVIGKDGVLYDPGFASALLEQVWSNPEWLQQGDTLYVAGVVGDSLLNRLRLVENNQCLFVRDFTRIFASGPVVNSYLASGRVIKTLYSTRPVAVTFNPLAPSGYRLDSEKMCKRLEEVLGIPVYDVRRL